MTLEIKNLRQPIDRYCSNAEWLVHLEIKCLVELCSFRGEVKNMCRKYLSGKIPPVKGLSVLFYDMFKFYKII